MVSESYPPALSASNRASFAYPTLKDRVPIIICKVIDLLHRNRSVRTDEGREDLKQAVEEMSRLRYELVTNKPMHEIPGDEEWNKALREHKEPKWFHTTWLLAECYAYRRLRECLGGSMVGEDVFTLQKTDSFKESREAILTLIRDLEEVFKKRGDLEQSLIALIKMSLWGNKCDLSISSGTTQGFEGDPSEIVAALDHKIIVDQSSAVAQHLLTAKENESETVDFVLDNVGFELISDLCLADFILESKLAGKIRFRAKKHPWFVSDTMIKDFRWTLDQLPESPTLERWRKFLGDGKWILSDEPFWTLPYDFSRCREISPELYSSMAEAKLVIFKGDLNYRKLVGDLAWNPEEKFETALRDFNPAPLVSLRTLKADVVVGLADGRAEQLSEQDPKWMTNGDWAVIQFCQKVK